MGGLALFRSSDLLTHYRLPMRCPELAVVADSFHVRPLFALFALASFRDRNDP
jgi:hypothetical protein